MTTHPPLPDLVVSAHAFAFVARFRSAVDLRHYLTGVVVDPHPDGGVILAGCDGVQLALVHDPLGHVSRPVILNTPRALLSACSNRKADKLATAGGRLVVQDRPALGWAQESMSFEHQEALERYVAPGRVEIDGRPFPYLQVLPEDPSSLVPGCFGYVRTDLATRAAASLQWLAEIHRRGLTYMTHWTHPGDRNQWRPIYTRHELLPNALVVTMPGRSLELSPLPAKISRTTIPERSKA